MEFDNNFQNQDICDFLPPDWEIIPLLNLLKIKHGYAFKGDFFKASGEFILMTPGHFDEQGGFRDQKEKTKYYIGEIPEGYLLNKGDLLVAMTEQKSGLLGSSAFVPEPGTYLHNQRLGLIEELDESRLDKQFLFHVLNTSYVRDEIAKTATGSKVKHTSPIKIRSVKIALPLSTIEQKKISYVLSTVQRAIAQQEQLIQTTTELKKALMHKLFTEGLHGEKQKETAIGLVPESWDVIKLGSIATKVSKGSSPRWQGYEYVENGILFVRSQNVGNGRLDFTDRVFLPPKFNQDKKSSILRSDDILINLVGASIGRVAYGNYEIEGANCNQAVCFVRVKKPLAFKQFIVHYLLSPTGQLQMHLQKKDIARANLSLLDVKNFYIPVPRDEEATEIAKIFSIIEQKIKIHEKKATALGQLFRTLLHQLMTAQIRVHDIDIPGFDESVLAASSPLA